MSLFVDIADDIADGRILNRKEQDFGFTLSEGSFWFKTKIKFDGQSDYLRSEEYETWAGTDQHQFSNGKITIIYLGTQKRFHYVRNSPITITAITATCVVKT